MRTSGIASRARQTAKYVVGGLGLCVYRHIDRHAWLSRMIRANNSAVPPLAREVKDKTASCALSGEQNESLREGIAQLQLLQVTPKEMKRSSRQAPFATMAYPLGRKWIAKNIIEAV